MRPATPLVAVGVAVSALARLGPSRAAPVKPTLPARARVTSCLRMGVLLERPGLSATLVPSAAGLCPHWHGPVTDL